MKVAGFNFIKNAVLYDYPIVEAITSILPICDAFYIAVGKSEDDTLDLIKNISSQKIRIIETVWDESNRVGGKILADETNKAFDAISEEFDWCFYVQGDEVIHEKYLSVIKSGMEKHLKDYKVEGLLFHYLHFFGSYDFYGDARKWYRYEIRIIRNDKSIRSYKDAQGFRKNGEKLKVKLIEAWVYHYGWVKHPADQQKKVRNFRKFWHSEDKIELLEGNKLEFDYMDIDSLEKFEGTHPRVMMDRIKRINWKFDFDPSYKNLNLKTRFLHLIEKYTGWRPGEYKNYRKS